VSTTVIGIPWQSQYGFNSSKQEDISGWTSTDNLTTATRSAVSLVTKNYMYILGGSNSNGYLDTIQSAPFDSNGALSSNWSKVGALPVSMGFMGYVATKSRFYLIGGYDGSNVLSTVYSAPINTDGTLGDFRAETPLPAARANAVCFVIKDKLYAIGGYTNTVYRATINSDGSLSSWETLSNFPISFDFGRPLLIKDRIYIFGAYDYNNNKESKNYYATYDSDGNIGSWTNVANMPNDIFISTMVCTDNYVFSMAGYDNNSGFKKATYRAPISADGSIGDWTQISDIPIAAAYAQSTIAGDKIYFIGGYDGSNYLDTVYLTTFTSGITDYTPYYTDQQNTSTTFNLPNYYTNASTGENYYIKY
jgi:N-acetylneuraminic acid mutarotase